MEGVAQLHFMVPCEYIIFHRVIPRIMNLKNPLKSGINGHVTIIIALATTALRGDVFL